MNLLLVCIISTYIIFSNLNETYSYSYVVPQDSCYNMAPGHNASKQTNLSPFKIVLNKKHYHPGEELKVSLIGLNESTYSGFLLQARLVKTEIIVGTWFYDNTTNPYVGIVKCLDKNNSLAHAWPQFHPKESRIFKNVTTSWVAPNVDNWDIEFIATVVKSYDVFWTNVKSDSIMPTSRYIKNKCSSLSSIDIYVLTFVFIIIYFKD